MILTIFNSISVMLCIYALISNKYKTNDKRVALLFVCLNIIFMRRLWVVIDPSIPLSLAYMSVNYIAFIALLLIMSIVKKDRVMNNTRIHNRIKKVLRPIKNRILKIRDYIKQRIDNLKKINNKCLKQ